MLMKRCEEHKQVRVQTAWLLMTPPFPDWLFSQGAVQCYDFIYCILSATKTDRGIREGSEVSIVLKKNKIMNYSLNVCFFRKKMLMGRMFSSRWQFGVLKQGQTRWRHSRPAVKLPD